jgi:hypothetical protein
MTGLLKGVRHEEDAGRRGDADNRRQRERGVDWCGERGYPGVRPTLHLGFQQ